MTADEVKALGRSRCPARSSASASRWPRDNGKPVVGAVIPGTPAEEAGLKRGDQILAVDGKTTDGETIDQTVARDPRARGRVGDPHASAATGVANFDVTIIRRKFDLPLVSWAMVPGRKVAMIRLDQFATGATKALKEAITAAKDAGATALIFDLRGNPGGYVNEAIGVASQFVADGIVYQSVDRVGQGAGRSRSSPAAWRPTSRWSSSPNGDTASAAEIVTGRHPGRQARARWWARRRSGPGRCSGGSTSPTGPSLRIGTERWLTRNGRPIWHEGLEPDVTVKLADTATPVRPDDLRSMTAAELASSTDTQLLQALELLQGKG